VIVVPHLVPTVSFRQRRRKLSCRFISGRTAVHATATAASGSAREVSTIHIHESASGHKHPIAVSSIGCRLRMWESDYARIRFLKMYNDALHFGEFVMTGFDEYITRFLNSYANRWQPFDPVILLLRLNLLKGGIITALIWWRGFVPKVIKREVAPLFCQHWLRRLARCLLLAGLH
jgi:hypothetical protein